MADLFNNHNKLLSLIIPCHNEATNIKPFMAACTDALPPNYRYELIFVDDGSSDDTADIIAALKPTASNINVRLIELSRNFGKEMAVTAGLAAAQGGAAIVIDADLQHPPLLLPKFISAWETGTEVVIGVRADDKRYASFTKRQGSRMFYRLINSLSPVEITPNATDYRLIDRVVIDAYNRFTEHNRMSRGLIDWLGFKRSYLTFTPAPRLNGEASYGLRKLTGLALNSIIGMSLVPLKFAGYLGATITMFFGSLGAFIAVDTYVFNDPLRLNVANSVDLAVLILFLIGIVLMALGLVGLYIAAIHTEVSGRPLYITRPKRPIE